MVDEQDFPVMDDENRDGEINFFVDVGHDRPEKTISKNPGPRRKNHSNFPPWFPNECRVALAATASVTVTQAYEVFCRLSQQRQLGTLKRSLFREIMRDLVGERYGLSLRNDVPDAQNRHQQAWRGLAVVEGEPLAA